MIDKELASCEAYEDCIDLAIQIVDDKGDKRAIENMMNYYDVVTKAYGTSRNMVGQDYVDHQDMKWDKVYGLMACLYYEKRKPFFENRCELSDE